METIPDEVLDRPVNGVSLMPGRLRDQLDDAPTLLVFLRHFGCIFCRETITDLRATADAAPDFPRVLFFFQGTPTEGRAFLRRYWPDVRAVSDPELAFYDAFGVGQASWVQALGPSVLIAGRRAKKKGHESGERSGDIWRMPGVIAVQGDRILWRYHPRHAADHPDFASIPGELDSPSA